MYTYGQTHEELKRVSNRPFRSERNMHSVKHTTDWTNDSHHTFLQVFRKLSTRRTGGWGHQDVTSKSMSIGKLSTRPIKSNTVASCPTQKLMSDIVSHWTKLALDKQKNLWEKWILYKNFRKKLCHWIWTWYQKYEKKVVMQIMKMK